jgi:hypothetical protein
MTSTDSVCFAKLSQSSNEILTVIVHSIFGQLLTFARSVRVIAKGEYARVGGDGGQEGLEPELAIIGRPGFHTMSIQSMNRNNADGSWSVRHDAKRKQAVLDDSGSRFHHNVDTVVVGSQFTQRRRGRYYRLDGKLCRSSRGLRGSESATSEEGGSEERT